MMCSCPGSVSFRGWRSVPTLAWGVLLIVFTLPSFAWSQPFPTNNDPANQIRFDTPTEADARRAQLVDFIWGGGLPTAMPAATTDVPFPDLAVGINPLNVARVDRLDVNVSGWDFHSVSYFMHPAYTANANRVVIVHQGHADTLEYGVGTTANHLLQNGFTVLTMEMPLFGWNTDTTAVVPGQGTLTYGSHDAMIYNTGPANSGWGFRLFLEPVVQNINYIVGTTPALEDIGMVGLSGGGWTTSLMSAIDTRISLSAPVAGSAPLYERNVATQGGTVGDPEQYYVPLYDEDIQPDGSGGGVCTWLEIYALGGYGGGRRQIQVTNEFDSCCFSGTFPDTYKYVVADKVASLGAGQWSHVLDSTHHEHKISSYAISTVIDPLFGITNPIPSPSGLPILDGFDDQTNAFPGGWSLDPSSGSGTTAVENAGSVTIRGAGLASIVRNVPFNPQIRQPITMILRISAMSSDNWPGVFITDQIGSRPHHLGVLINGSTGQVAVNADNGGGFDGTKDRVYLGTLAGYSGGPVTLGLTFDTGGFSVEADAGAGGSLSSGKRAWSDIPNGFDAANLGEDAQLFIQGFDINGGTAASVSVDSVEVQGTFVPGDFDGDGDADGNDVAILVGCKLGPAVPQASPWCEQTDVDADGDVDQSDFGLLQVLLTGPRP
jgi:hypothetical protein